MMSRGYLLSAIAGFLATGLALYTCVAFVLWSFDFVEWGMDNRLVFILLWPTVAPVGVALGLICFCSEGRR